MDFYARLFYPRFRSVGREEVNNIFLWGEEIEGSEGTGSVPVTAHVSQLQKRSLHATGSNTVVPTPLVKTSLHHSSQQPTPLVQTSYTNSPNTASQIVPTPLHYSSQHLHNSSNIPTCLPQHQHTTRPNTTTPPIETPLHNSSQHPILLPQHSLPPHTRPKTPPPLVTAPDTARRKT